tara:strand:+ start:16 stop:507 length:492 start_codon:yes stop_codon:yes gene_type:complete
MKKLILILMVGSLFGDTIRYKEGLLLAKTKVNVEFLGVSDKKVYFIDVNNNIDFVVCKTVKEIINSDGNEIIFDCKIKTYNIRTREKSDRTYKDGIEYLGLSHKIGGLCIALGGTMLITNLDDECIDCSTIEAIEDFTKGIQAQQKIAYLFIIMGGLIIAIGN